MVASSGFTNHATQNSTTTAPESTYQEEMCDKLIQLSFAKIVNSKSERGGARLHKNLLILHLLQQARHEQRNRLLYTPMMMDTSGHGDEVEHEHGSIPNSDNSEVDEDEMNDDIDENMRHTSEHMQTDSLMEDDDEDVENEIDETFGQQEPLTTENSENVAGTGTFSTLSYYVRRNDGRDSSQDYEHHLTLSATAPALTATGCLSDASQEVSDFDGPTEERRQQAPEQTESSAEITENDNHQNFDFSNTAETTDGEKSHLFNENENSTRPRRQRSHRRRRSSSKSVKELNRTGIRHSASSSSPSSSETSSSSEDSDESCSSEDNYLLNRNTAENDVDQHTKSRDCLKRKLDDSCTSHSTLISTCDAMAWYSSPKIACMVHHHSTVTTASAPTIAESTTQNQNLNGLISVFQSAALTSSESDESSKTSKIHEQENTEFRIFESGTNSDDLTPTRSLSCPGLMELACES